jgi:anti-sigma factor RsiW
VDILIDDLSLAAYEAIETAAAEAARAAALASLEREAVAMREAHKWRIEAEMRQQAIIETQKAGRKKILLAGVIGIFGGLAVGIGGTLIIQGR